MAKAEDQDSFFRIPADSRDLNYDEFFEKGDVYRVSHDTSGEYNSHNTQRLDVDGVINLLMKLPFIKSKLND